MLKTEEKKTAKAESPKTETIDKGIVEQYNLMQQLIGTTKLNNMKRDGILPKNMPKTNQKELEATEHGRSLLEEKQINKDREALLPQIMKKIRDKDDKMAILKKSKPGTPIYANIELNLEYSNIPGEKPIILYNTTELKSADLSYENINTKKEQYTTSKGFVKPVVFSFLIDKNDKTSINNEEEQYEEQKQDKSKKDQQTKQNTDGKAAKNSSTSNEEKA